jgi:hypothetical protein
VDLSLHGGGVQHYPHEELNDVTAVLLREEIAEEAADLQALLILWNAGDEVLSAIRARTDFHSGGHKRRKG